MVRSVEKITLEFVGPMVKVRIKTIQAQEGAKKRIADIGLSHGTKVGKIRHVPFNRYIKVEGRGYHISLRNSNARPIKAEDGWCCQ